MSRIVIVGFLQEPHLITSQKTEFFIVTAVETANLIVTTPMILLECCNDSRLVLNHTHFRFASRNCTPKASLSNDFIVMGRQTTLVPSVCF
jgi:hypothetical protein